jgi:hypothetical protein
VALTADDIQEQIILEVGDVDPASGDPPARPEDGVLARRMDVLWRRFAAKGPLAPGLRELYVKRACVRLVLGILAQRRFDAADTIEGLSLKANQIYEHYLEMQRTVQAEIEATEGQFATGRRAYRGGTIARTAPVSPPRPPDANRARYGGSPYAARRRRGSP